MKNCTKCGGSGHIASYNYISKGICFKCKGSGKIGGASTEEYLKSQRTIHDTLDEMAENHRKEKEARESAVYDADGNFDIYEL